MRAGHIESLLEEIVTSAWHEALGVPPASLDEDFFAIGGHSLLAAEVTARFERVLGLEIPLNMVFDHPTVKDQIAWIAQTAGSDHNFTTSQLVSGAAAKLAGRGIDALLELGRRQRAPESAALLAAVAVLVARQLGRSDIVIGIPGGPVAISLAGEPSFETVIDRAVIARQRGLAIGAGLADGGMPRAYDAYIELDDPLLRVAAAESSDALRDEIERVVDELVARPGAAVGVAAPAPTPPSADALSLPLSHAQERLWFVENLSSGTTANHVQRVYRIRGSLDPALLERAIAAVATRHATLRTTFRLVDGAPCQVVGAAMTGEHAFETIAARSAVAERARDEYERPFDLGRGPLWRTRLCSTAPDDHSLILTAHHIIIDAHSIHLWLRELSEHYGALAGGTRPRVADITTTVGDIALWERSPDGRQAIAEHLRFWIDELAGARSLDLPIDFKRPTTPSVARHHVSMLVPPDRVAELRAVARRSGATLNCALIAAAFAFLSRLTGQDDLVCVVPATNRNDPAREKLIGLLLNLLPLRVRLDGDPTFAEIIARTDRAMRVALRHSDAPFERIAASAGVPREPGRQPLFDITLNMVPGIDWFRSSGLRYSQESVKNTAQPCDMVISASTKPGGVLDLVLRCREDLFAAVTAERMLRRFSTLLLAGTAEPELQLSRLPFIPDDERTLVVETWNQDRIPLPDSTVHDLVSGQLRRAPDAIAVRQHDRVMTGGELEERATRLAARLRVSDVAPGTPIGIAIPPSPELVIAALGVMKAGAVYVPFDTSHPAARLESLAREVAFVIDPTRLAADTASAPTATELALSPDAPSYIVFTSGSTGEPKSVSTTHRALVNQILWFRRDVSWQRDEIACLRSSPAFADSLWEIFGPLADGIPLAIATAEEMLDPRLLARMVARESVTRLVVVPSLLHALLELGAGNADFLPSVSLWLSTSEELKPALVRRFFAARPSSRLINLYGCSETGAEVSSFEVTAPDPVRTPIGKPIANTRIYVLDDARQPQPIGVYGEIYIGGAGVSEAYRKAPPGADRFPVDPFVPGARVYRSGDRGRWRHDGVLDYVGRVDHVLKIRGVRIDPGEVENAMLSHPDIAAAVVTAATGSDGEPRLVAHFVPRLRAPTTTPAVIDHGELRRFLRARLPETLIPTSLAALDELPLGPTGKIDRTRLPLPSFSGSASRAPQGAVEQAVALVWEQVLGRACGAEDDFFAVGGESLLAAQLGARLGERFGVELPLPVLFERPTIAAQAAWIEDATRAGSDASIPRVASGSAPLSFAQERLWFSAALAPHAAEPRLRYVLRLDGPLDIDRLQAAMGVVAARQDSLRTVFFDDANGITQRVLASAPRDHLFEDASRAEHDAAIRSHLSADRARPFDRASGPPWRTRLLRLRDGLHVLIVTFHHFVADGISIQHWLEEVDECYRALAAGIAPALAPLPVTARDVAVWQRRMVDSGAWNASREFWKSTLAGAQPVDLPSVAPRTGWSTGAGGRVRADLSLTSAEAIAARALDEQTTLFGFLYAGVAILVHALVDRTDLTIGTVLGGRDRPEVRPLIGLFLNPLPLRCDLSGDPDLREVVRRAGVVTRAALAHGDVPFERIVADVNPERRAYRQPFFDVVINHHPPGFPPRLGDLRVSHLRGMAPPVAPYELMFRAISHPAGLVVQLDFQRDRFAEDVVRGWLDRYVELLHVMVSEPQRRLSECRRRAQP